MYQGKIIWDFIHLAKFLSDGAASKISVPTMQIRVRNENIKQLYNKKKIGDKKNLEGALSIKQSAPSSQILA